MQSDDDIMPRLITEEEARQMVAWMMGEDPKPKKTNVVIDASHRAPGPSTGTGTELATKEKP